MKRVVHLPAIAEVGGGRDNFALYDISGFADAAMTLKGIRGDWYGNHSLEQAACYLREGDLSAVPAADAIMSKLDGQIFMTRAYRVVDDVIGAVPNVPAYIAGIPQNMRLRQRTATHTAPLSVFIDLTTSGGVEANDVRQRGITILALVRLLSNVRPVEAWAFVGLGNSGRAHYVCVHLDTAPLDLARAAHVLTSTMVARGIGYGLCKQFSDDGNWPYANIDKIRKHGAAILKRVVHPGSEVLLVPAMHMTDATVKTPVKWIQDMLAKYGGVTAEAA